MTDNSESGATEGGTIAIFRAIAKNPLSAFNILLITAGFIGTYYTITNELKSTEAEIVQVKSDATYAALGVKAEAAHMADRVTALDARGAVRYEEIKHTLGQHDVTLAEIANDVKWIVRRLDNSAGQGNNNAGPPPTTHQP